MAGIQSSIGVITGIPIQDTVDQLIAISARPRDLLIERNAALKQQQLAIGELTAKVIGVQLAIQNLRKTDVFSAVDVTSSNPALVSTTVTGTPPKGNFSFQPIRQAQFHQSLSSRFASDDSPIGAGTFKLRYGGFVDESMRVDDLNGGSGIERGQIRITDRSGASSVIDLRYVETVDDVLNKINSNTDINVSASVSGDQIVLQDHSGQTLSNLRVQQLGTGTTAADLGLEGIDVAADSATGNDIVSLSSATKLSSLNDGSGVTFNSSLAELSVTFRDNSAALELDFDQESTLGEVLDTINSADPARLKAQISADGDRIELIDLTTDAGGTFSVSSINSSTTAEDLGLDTTAVADTLTGGRIQAGLGTVLLSSLGGGQGLGDLGSIDVTTRDGASGSVDLSSAETLDDVVAAINNSGLSVTASVNSARSGIQLEDTSGGTGNFTVANAADGFLSADKLQIAIDDAVSSVDSGSLSRQIFGRSTSLDLLNGGAGVDDSSFIITDSSGAIGAVNIATDGIETLGDLIDAINGTGIGVTASINQTGDGIQLVDTAGGPGTLSVEESGNGTAAADLKIVGEATLVDLGAGLQQVIDGAQSPAVEIDADDTLDDLIEKINAADVGVSASKFFDGVGYRLSLTSLESGAAGRFQVEGLNGITFSEVAEGRDALIAIGSPDSQSGAVLASSTTNTFDQVIDGVSFTLTGSSQELVTISVNETDSKIITNIKLFVEQYNALQDTLEEQTSFESNGSESDPSIRTGVLFGTTEALRVQQTLSGLITGRFFGVGAFQSAGELGIDVDENGRAVFDEERFKAQYSSDPDSVRQFFTGSLSYEQEQINETYGDQESIQEQYENRGFANKFDLAIEGLAGVGDSLLLTRNKTLQSRIDANDDRISKLSSSLDRERDILLKQFFTLESTIQKLQANQSSLDSLQPLPPLVSVN